MNLQEVIINNPIKPDYTAKVFMERRTESQPIDFPERRKSETVPRVAFNSCDICDKDFPGPFGGSDYAKHLCVPKEARERLQRELKATRVKKSRIEAALADAFLTAVEQLGYVAAIESIAHATEGVGERDEINADTWSERAVVLFKAAEFGEEL